MGTQEPELDSNSAEMAPPRTSWRSPRTWAFFAADAAYSGLVAGAITIIACLVAGLSYELKAGSVDGWWLVLIAMVVLSGLHLEIFDRWLLPGTSARPIGLRETLPGGSGGALLGGLSFVLSILTGMALVAVAQSLLALPDAWEWQLPTVMIAVVINEGTLLKLLLHRARIGSGC